MRIIKKGVFAGFVIFLIGYEVGEQLLIVNIIIEAKKPFSSIIYLINDSKNQNKLFHFMLD